MNHQNITTTYDIYEEEDPATVGRQTFIAMECVEGETLKDKLEKGPLKTKELLNIAIAVAAGDVHFTFYAQQSLRFSDLLGGIHGIM